MARSVWRGTLSFGLVSIGVSLYPATEPKDVRFHLFDREGRRVRYKRVVDAGPVREPEVEDAGADDVREAPSDDVDDPAASDETEVAYEELVKGYEIEPETFVFLEPQEIERARPAPSRTIDLEHFVRLEDIDPVYFEKAYYAVPTQGAENAYLLLLRALQDAGRVGVGRFVLRTKPHLVAVRPLDRVLALETLYFGDEVREVAPLVRVLDGRAVKPREVELAKQLVDAMAADWDPARFADEYREELLRMIAERTPQRIEEEAPARAPGGRIEDLMDALRQSVEDAKAGREPKGRRQAG